jgi:cellulose synthase/poly-beta-1,6-N-acetylglucosamine synthase-like glycosyltransferase
MEFALIGAIGFWQLYHWTQLSLSIFALAVAGVTVVVLTINYRVIERLLDVPIPELKVWPRISLIAPARNEERNIAAAMRSLLQIDYPNLQITIINDRSTDRTGEILQQLANAEPRLNVVEVTELPPGWLGKNHAMHLGARQSDGEWLLFTDADILFEPTTLRRAIGYANEHLLDHLAAYPDVRMPGWLLNSFVITFATMFTMFIRPWQVRDPKSKAYIGIGAFNLVSAEAYRVSGGHVPIRMRPDDDLKLGHLLKLNGFRSDVVNGQQAVTVEWYATLGEMIRGLEKNSAAPLEYDVAKVLGSCLILFLANIWPFVAVLITRGWPQLLFALTIVLLLMGNAQTAINVRQPLWRALLFPVAISIFTYIQLRGIVLLLVRGGIQWRGTFYPLADLKANRI